MAQSLRCFMTVVHSHIYTHTHISDVLDIHMTEIGAKIGGWLVGPHTYIGLQHIPFFENHLLRTLSISVLSGKLLKSFTNIRLAIVESAITRDGP